MVGIEYPTGRVDSLDLNVGVAALAEETATGLNEATSITPAKAVISLDLFFTYSLLIART